MTAGFDLLPPEARVLGKLAWPLIACSLLALALILERLVFFVAGIGGLRRRALLDAALAPETATAATPERTGAEALHDGRGALARALRTLRATPAAQREAVAQMWFDAYRQRHLAHLGWLNLIAVISPLLGLLGTVLGMIRAFAELAGHTGPVSPALLAGGLQQAMTTTAAGLMIAVPTLIAAHAFRIWARARGDAMAACLNRIQLGLQGCPAHDAEFAAAATTADDAAPGAPRLRVHGAAA